MDIRNREMLMACAAIIAFVLSAVLVVRHLSAGHGASNGDAYFYDLHSGSLFAAPRDAVAPIADRDGVRAHVYGCGDCTEPSRRIAYLSRLSDEAKRVLDEPDAASRDKFAAMDRGRLVAAVPESVDDPAQWVPIRSPRGLAVTARLGADCPKNVNVRDCAP